MSTHKIFEISPTETYGENVKLAAVVSEVRIIVTKNSGAEMAFVKVDDGTGVIELVVFPNVLERNPDAWKENSVVVARGKINDRDGVLKLLCDTVKPLALMSSA